MYSGQVGLCADAIELGGLMILEDLRVGKHSQDLRAQSGHIDLGLTTIVFLMDLGANGKREEDTYECELRKPIVGHHDVSPINR